MKLIFVTFLALLLSAPFAFSADHCEEKASQINCSPSDLNCLLEKQLTPNVCWSEGLITSTTCADNALGTLCVSNQNYGDEMGNSFPCNEAYLFRNENFVLVCTSCIVGDVLSRNSCAADDILNEILGSK